MARYDEGVAPKKAHTVRQMNNRVAYDAWWRSGPGLPCITCKQGDSDHARAVRAQGPSFFPMRVFGPDHLTRPVRYVLVSMEPSEDRFDLNLARGMDPEHAWNLGGASATPMDSALQFAAREWLCEASETFFVTDIAKCAVRNPRDEPSPRRRYRWNNCAPFLEQEVGMFDLRAVIAVGGAVGGALRRRPSIRRHNLFRVVHWASWTATQERVLASQAERQMNDLTIDRYVDFMSERRVAVGKTPKRQKPNAGAKTLLAVYRKQFGCIKRALENPDYDCGRRGAESCCKAVPRQKINA